MLGTDTSFICIAEAYWVGFGSIWTEQEGLYLYELR